MAMSALGALGHTRSVHTQSVGGWLGHESGDAAIVAACAKVKIRKVSLVGEGETVEVLGVRWR
jgi:hypothetical protein